ncbi:NAD(P)H-binding protein [Olivibacter sp. SDN3]|uniref:NmrA family NAD(P)-binding protein n=1 Tax=Olivibacter sp. SDN3 TaxID=2764720 RepID=UPI001650D7AC|nr:NAD(P)H-binding protein [Olivibacter sp. SDN3]QNL52029.1 NAD(P)H-binding protein [Olivibacter sp. SDN3]
MHIILGATGQIGSALVSGLLENGQTVKAIIRDEQKAHSVPAIAAVEVADLLHLPSLIHACSDATTLFVLTPEDPKAIDVLATTRSIIENYRKVVVATPVKKIVGLSSIGAQHEKGTGNLRASYLLEHAFEDLAVQQIFIRPAYYFSNWLPYLGSVKEQGILPTFFPVDQQLPMVAPNDVAAVLTDVMIKDSDEASKRVYEVEGPTWYSAADVALAFSQSLDIDVRAEQVPRAQWEEMLQSSGFSADAATQLIEMTEAVIDGRALPEGIGNVSFRGQTTLQRYIAEIVAQPMT